MSVTLRQSSRNLPVLLLALIVISAVSLAHAADNSSVPATGSTGSSPVIGDGASLLFMEGSLLREFELKRDEIYLKGNTGLYEFRSIPVLPSAAGLVDYLNQINSDNEDVDALMVIQRKWDGPLSTRVVTRNMKVKLKEGHRTMGDALFLAETFGVAIRRDKVSELGWTLFEAESSIDAIAKAAQIAQHEFVQEAGPKLHIPPKSHACESDENALNLNDRLFSSQWYYNENVPGPTVSVQPVWINRIGPNGGVRFLARPYTGDGIRIGIADTGLEIKHEDLERNVVKALCYDFLETDKDPTSDDAHGTNVGGLAAARGGNGVGIIGAAPEADLVGYRFLDTGALDSDLFDRSPASIDILNNSWGYDAYVVMDEDDIEALEDNVRNRDRVFTFSSGNEREAFYLDSYLAYQNSRYTIAVGALNSAGLLATYSNPGPGVFVVGLASDQEQHLNLISTTYPNDYTTDGLEGTSFSCPMVSGICALMLEARPDLTWRDVQGILRETANFRDPETAFFPPFHTNADGWGLAHGAFAVKTAETWALLPKALSTDEVETSNEDIAGSFVDFFFDFKGAPNPNMIVEHVELDVEWKGGSADREVSIEIASPTTLYREGEAPRPLDVVSGFSNTNNLLAPEVWKYTHVGFWGQNSTRGTMNGVWRVRMRMRTGETRQTDRLTLTLHGSPNTYAPSVIGGVVQVASAVGVDNPRVAEDEEDITVTGVELQDFDLDPINITYQWQVQPDERGDFIDLAGFAGSFSDICNYAGPRVDFEVSDYPIRRTRVMKFTDVTKSGCASIVSWDWNFGDGTPNSTLQNPTHTYAITAPNSVNVTLNVVDSNGATGTFTKSIRVLNDGAAIPGNLLPLDYNDPPAFLGDPGFAGGQNSFGQVFTLPGSVTTPGYSYRLSIMPSDEERTGALFFSQPIFVLSPPPEDPQHGDSFVNNVKLPILFSAPYELPPYVLVDEFSQGELNHPANGEWVEMLTTVEVDMRNYSISNNLSTFDAVFANIEFWRHVPAGTLITVYNSDFPDSVLPPDDLDYTDGTMVIPSNSDLLTLPSNGEAWGEFPNFSPGFVAVLDNQCVSVSGVSYNEDKTYVELNIIDHGLPAANISQHEAAWVTVGSLIFDGEFTSYQQVSSWTVGTALEATPGVFNPGNATVLNEINMLLDIVGGGTGPVNTVPEYSYTPPIPGITINPETGVMSGIIDVPEGGIFPITVTRALSWDSFSQSFPISIETIDDDSDPDNDGVPALIERATGMSNSIADAERLPTITVGSIGVNKFLVFNYRQLKIPTFLYIDNTDDDLMRTDTFVYELWTSPDLVNWTNSSAGFTRQTSTNPTNTLFNDVKARLNAPITAGQQIFIQLRVTRIPGP
jgi:PKD repeat protein